MVIALRSAITGYGQPVGLVAHEVGRYARQVEAAAYFCCLEALQNAAKHSRAATISVELRGLQDRLELTVEDDGIGFDPAVTAEGAGLANIRDRVESVGGTVTTDSVPGRGCRIRLRLPAQALTATRGGG